MSQAGQINSAAGPVPPTVATSYETQDGIAVPVDNILIINALDSEQDNDNGIITKAGTPATPFANEVDIVLTNRLTGTVTTSDATLTTIITLSMDGPPPTPATPATFYVYGNVQAFNASIPASGTYSFSGGFRTDGTTSIELGTQLHDEFEDPVLVSSDIFISASGVGNNILLQVQGIAATSINWGALMEYRRVI